MRRLLLLIAISCASASADYIRVPQGWDEATREQVYHESEGSELMPLSWFMALERPGDQTSFVQGLKSVGVLAGEGDLPIGFAAIGDDKTSRLYGEKRWVGINCATCHTSMIEINGQQVVIEGGANMFDLDQFQVNVAEAVDATLNSPDKFARFQAQLKNPPGLKTNLQTLRDDLRGLVERNKYTVNGKRVRLGPEHMDGLGLPNNEAFCHFAPLGDLDLARQIAAPGNCRDFPSVTGIPQAWGTYNQEYTHFIGAIHSSIGRNVGQASGVYAKNWWERGASGEPVLNSTASFEGLQKIENWYKLLRAPEWKDLAATGLVPQLDAAKVERGQKLFNSKNCISCHAIQPEMTARNIPLVGREFWKITVSGLNEVGTDPARLNADLGEKVTLPSILEAEFKNQASSPTVGPDNQVSASAYRAMYVTDIINKMFIDNGLSMIQKFKASSCRLPDRVQSKVGYKARSLEGIVFTAPYLHNSSVPTLDDLFKPASQRPQSFYVGCRKYDIQRAGYECDANSGFLVDTHLPGFSNQGHEFGTDMSPDERADMIEFLKSLTNPTPPALGICS